MFAPDVQDGGRTHLYRPTYVPDIDPAWPLIAGDCLHNARSALDHLAVQLVIVSGGTPTRKTAFPIQHPADAFIAPGITNGIQSVVNSVQPGRSGDDPKRNWLAILKDLDNLDKHRQLVVVAGATAGVGIHGDGNGGTVKLLPPRLKVGRPAVRITYPEPLSEGDPGVRVVLGLVFQGPNVLRNFGVTAALDNIIARVADTVDRFRDVVPDL
jgi:hypothetical protein